MKEIYDQILNDSKIKDIYNQIHDYEDNTEICDKFNKQYLIKMNNELWQLN